MKIFTNKKIFNKIVIILVIVMTCSFIIPNNSSNAATFQKDKENVPGGKMLEPIMNLLMYIGDAILNILQNNFLTTEEIITPANTEECKNWNGGAFNWVLLGIIGIGFGVLTIATGGLAAIVVGAIVTIASGAVAYCAGGIVLDDLQGEFDIPKIQYTPYMIFSGQIPALDINFIEPMDPIVKETITKEKAITEVVQGNFEEYKNLATDETDGENAVDGVIASIMGLDETTETDEFKKKNNYDSAKCEHYEDETKYIYGGLLALELIQTTQDTFEIWENNNGQVCLIKSTNFTNYSTDSLPVSGTAYKGYVFNKQDIPEISDEAIDSKIEANTTYYESSGRILQSSIATWYKVLRTVALVGLLSVLVYIGIRILFTSVAAEKAKYKKMIVDWVVAICMLFILHYLMVFILNISTKITEVFLTNSTTLINQELPPDTKINGTKLSEMDIASKEEAESKAEGRKIDLPVEMSKDGNPVWVGDFVGYIRLYAGVSVEKNSTVYALMYLVIVIYTCMFTFMYLKRVLYMAFLTMIAPLIALTYPLDKIKDGKAQAFSLWIREYIFNALIQPVHLMLYTMVISTVLDLAVDHPVYAIVALGFFTPAEKFIRKMFGFENAGTISAFGQIAGGAAVMTAINQLGRLNKRKKKDGEGENDKPTRTADQNGFNLGNMFNGNDGSKGGDSDSTSEPNLPTPREGDPDFVGPPRPPRTPREGDPDFVGPPRPPRTPREGDPDFVGPPRPPRTPRGGDSDSTSEPTPPTIQNNGSKDNKNSFGHKVVRGMNKVGNRYKNKLIKAKPLRAIGKYTAMGIGGATLGIAGLAAGIATGDPSKALSFTAAGAGVGGALGKTTAENVMDEGAEIKENFAKGYQGEKEYTNKKLDRQYFSGEKFDEMLEQEDLHPELSGKERAKKMQEDIQQYRNSGITDNGQISTCMRLGLTPEQGVYATQLSQSMEKSGWNNPKIRQDYENRSKELLKSQKGMTQEEVDKIWNATQKLLF